MNRHGSAPRGGDRALHLTRTLRQRSGDGVRRAAVGHRQSTWHAIGPRDIRPNADRSPRWLRGSRARSPPSSDTGLNFAMSTTSPKVMSRLQRGRVGDSIFWRQKPVASGSCLSPSASLIVAAARPGASCAWASLSPIALGLKPWRGCRAAPLLTRCVAMSRYGCSSPREGRR